ncbi:MAG TPA: hypothetical protein VFI42_15700 [Thermomicrobiaceae bacterium]|nr:hypothetical protein [Thermomicrobiaceae bacterium]
MRGGKYRLIGRRADRPQSLLFRDEQGRHFLRSTCGARLVRLTARDAQRILRQYPYTSVLDAAWRDYQEALGYECPIQLPDELEILPADGN